MDKPTFDQFHPNASECQAACDEAEAGNLAGACSWLSEAQTGLEYLEALEDYEAATKYVQHKAKEAGVALKSEKPFSTTQWSVGETPGASGSVE